MGSGVSIPTPELSPGHTGAPVKHISLAELESQLADARTNLKIPLFLSPLVKSADGEMISPIERHLKRNYSPVFINVKALAHEVYVGNTMTVADARTQLHAQLFTAYYGDKRRDPIDKHKTNEHIGDLLVLQLADTVFDFVNILFSSSSFNLYSSLEIGAASFQVVFTSTLSALEDSNGRSEIRKPSGSPASTIRVIAVNPVDLENEITLVRRKPSGSPASVIQVIAVNPADLKNENTLVKQDCVITNKSEKGTPKRRLSLSSRIASHIKKRLSKDTLEKPVSSFSELVTQRHSISSHMNQEPSLGMMRQISFNPNPKLVTQRHSISSHMNLERSLEMMRKISCDPNPRPSLKMMVHMSSNPSPRSSLDSSRVTDISSPRPRTNSH